MRPLNVILTLVTMSVLALGACGDDGDDHSTDAGISADTFNTASADSVPFAKPDAFNKTNKTDGAPAGDPCTAYCQAIIAAGCPSGPPTEAACVTNCSALQTGPCKSAWDQALACAGASPQGICVDGKPTIEGCEANVAAISTCKQSMPDGGSK